MSEGGRDVSKTQRIVEVAALLWSVASAILLIGVAVMIIKQPRFPLNIGLIRTQGLPGLWVTLLPAVVGLAGVVLVRGRIPLGTWLLMGYSGFWAVVVATGLPMVWNAQNSFCLTGIGFCITSPWIARLTALGLLGSFVLVGVWSWCRRSVRGPMRTE